MLFKKGKLFSVLFVKICLTFFGAAICIGLIFYTQCNIYDFPETYPFSGKSFYNPYQGIENISTLKANFHAHSKAWNGFTNGDDDVHDLLKKYNQQGFGFGGISNYFSTSKINCPYKVYEHGINLMKAHKLAINPSKIEYFDYPFFQTLSLKQDIINRLLKNNAQVVLAHPNFCNGHSKEDMKQMVGYHFVEIRSYYANAFEEWDEALKTGKLSWLMANDDTHGLKKQPIQRFYNEVFACKKEEILQNMSQGKHFGIEIKLTKNDLELKQMKIEKETLTFDFGNHAQQVEIWGDGKLLKKYSEGRTKFQIPLNIHFIRLIAESKNSRLFTNPIIRKNTEQLHLAAYFYPKTNQLKTILVRLIYWAIFITVLFSIILLWFSEKILQFFPYSQKFYRNLELSKFTQT